MILCSCEQHQGWQQCYRPNRPPFHTPFSHTHCHTPINQQAAMKARDSGRLDAIRFLSAAIKQREIELRESGKQVGVCVGVQTTNLLVWWWWWWRCCQLQQGRWRELGCL